MLVLLMILAADPDASAVFVRGVAEIERPTGNLPLSVGSPISKGDVIKTADGEVRVRMRDRTLMRIGPQSRVQISTLSFNGDERESVSVKLFVGRLWAAVQKRISPNPTFQVEAASAVAGVRGTELAVERDSPDGEVLMVTLTGLVNIKGSDDALTILTPGYAVTVSPKGIVGRPKFASGAFLASLRDRGLWGEPFNNLFDKFLADIALSPDLLAPDSPSANGGRNRPDLPGDPSPGELRQRGGDIIGNDRTNQSELVIHPHLQP